jgi:hypothetical protein
VRFAGAPLGYGPNIHSTSDPRIRAPLAHVRTDKHQFSHSRRAVVWIAFLAVVRKFIVIEIGEADAVFLLALSASTLARGGAYWAVREQDGPIRTAESKMASLMSP